MGAVVDLRAVRDARAELARLVTIYPELQGERSPKNVEGWILTLEKKQEMAYAKYCKQCGKPFIAQRSTAEFDHDMCRAAWNRRQLSCDTSPLTEALNVAAELNASYAASRGLSDENALKKRRDQALRVAHAAIEAELHLAPIDPPEAPIVRARFDAANVDALRVGVRAILDRGQSQRAFAVECGIDPAELSRFLNGKRILPDEKRERIAAALANA